MLGNDAGTSDLKGDYPLTSVVILKKGPNGIIQANPVANLHLMESRTYAGNHNRPKADGGKAPRKIEQNYPASAPKESFVKRLAGVLGILLTVGGALFIAKHQGLVGSAKTWGSKSKD